MDSLGRNEHPTRRVSIPDNLRESAPRLVHGDDGSRIIGAFICYRGRGFLLESGPAGSKDGADCPERKTTGDSRDWLKTVVAFANSAPVGYPAILFIGVRDDGTIEGETNLDSLQRTVSEKLSAAYPPIYYLSRVLPGDGKQFLAVLIPGSENRPHFAGPAFIREGSKSIQSSATQFEILVAERDSKVREIRRWKGQVVTFQRSASKELYAVHVLGTTGGKLAGTVIDCNAFYITVESTTRKGSLISIPLGQIEINFDHVSKCLELRFRD